MICFLLVKIKSKLHNKKKTSMSGYSIQHFPASAEWVKTGKWQQLFPRQYNQLISEYTLQFQSLTGKMDPQMYY